jgi:hypothetical protein
MQEAAGGRYAILTIYDYPVPLITVCTLYWRSSFGIT